MILETLYKSIHEHVFTPAPNVIKSEHLHYQAMCMIPLEILPRGAKVSGVVIKKIK
jgi:hypothetical protein